ncbi:M61 family metallopeptidase [Altericroceibacterium xinjiangense]|uniref:M61 family metallopeptidase n=1 Tax=Altericroceibacterium xinjiangense TaxID=762261 RepID=UPI001F498C8F|nr:peptidase M61 [Altericroceibacterium xinjiangense]
MKTQLLLALSASALLAAPAAAQMQPATNSAPQAVPIVTTVPDARDVRYPGTIRLDIDATDTLRGLYKVTQVVPVPSGARELVLQLPEWLPGNHAPRGPINLLANIGFEVDGQPVQWTRDPLEVHAFRIPLPEGARQVTARFVHTSPIQPDQGRITMTQEMLNLQWEKMSLYPAGYYTRQIPVQPTVTFPAGWQVFTALDGQQANGSRVTWATTDYETLVDSPIFAGQHAQSWPLGHDVRLNVVADEPGLLAVAPENLRTYNTLVDEALALFGAKHFDRYEFLLALTDRMGGIGLEHHRSSENQYDPTTLVDWEAMDWDRNVIAHELVHSWNGKYRRPADLWTPDYRTPMQNSLLWMYEGQTQFWGNVLAARSGVQQDETVLGAFATYAANYTEGQPGRAWRSVADTTNDPIINSRRPLPYSSLTRSEDYYSEGALVWLEADQIIRQGTGGRKGLDDFARAFFGMRDGDWGQLTYTFEDIVGTLNQVYPYDWADFLTTRLYQPGQPGPLRGIEMAGYKLVWKDEPNPYEKGRMSGGEYLSLFYSLGLNLDRDGNVGSALWDGPAFRAGIVPGMQIVAVNGQDYDEERIRTAIQAARGGTEPINLLVKRGESFLTIPVDYHGGLRYPWLEKAVPGEAGLDRLLAPRTDTAR